MTVRMVWAQSDGGVIGADGALPWHLPEDLRLFRALTLGATVVMGRRTWQSLPPRVRPLPGRRNVVLSATLAAAGAGVPVVPTPADALASAGAAEDGKDGEDGDLWVIGGGQVYAAFLPHAAAVVVTEVDARLPGDTWAPELGPGWAAAAQVPADGWAESAAGLRFRVSVRERWSGAAGPVPAVLAEQQRMWNAGGRSGGGGGAGR